MTTLFLAGLIGCGGPSAQAPVSKATPEPELPPPVAAGGPPMVLINGNYLNHETKLNEGEEVQVVCGSQVITGPVELLPVGEGRVHPTVMACPDYKLLLRGMSDRIGNGVVRPGIGQGILSAGRPKIISFGQRNGALTAKSFEADGAIGLDVRYEVDDGPEYPLFRVEQTTGVVGLNWIGDLDDDGGVDFLLNSPITVENHHLRLYLSGASPDQAPQLALETQFTLW